MESVEAAQCELLSWPGVTVHDHRFGGLEFRANGREMGYIHGDVLADMPFPRDVGKKLVEEGKASPHHVLPESGWISYYIKGPAGVDGMMDLFRMQYDRMTSHSKKPIRVSSS